MFKLSVGVSCALGLGACNAHAQVYSWNTDQGGDWSDQSKWSPEGVPSDPGESAIIHTPGDYEVTIDGDQIVIDGLTLTNPTATLGITNAAVLSIGAVLENDATILIHPDVTPASATLRFNGLGVLTGSGEIILGNQFGALLSSINTPLSNGASHTIRGSGVVAAPLDNVGIVAADSSVGSGIQLSLTADSANSGTMTASTLASLLYFDGVSITGGGGTITAAQGRTVFGLGCTVNDQQVGSAGTGRVVVSAGATLNLQSSQILGELDLAGGGRLACTSSDGAGAVLNSDGAALTATLDFPVGGTIGAGASPMPVRMRHEQRAVITGGPIVIHPAGRVRGVGEVAGHIINNGVMTADKTNVFAGDGLTITAAALSNNNLLETSSDSTLTIAGTHITQGPAGTIHASAGDVVFANARVEGGTLRAQSPSSVRIQGTSTLDGVTNMGEIVTSAGNRVRLESAFINSGILYVASGDTGSATLDIATPGLRVSGSGIMELFSPERSKVVGLEFIIESSQTLMGSGVVQAAFRNEGTIALGVVQADQMTFEGASKTNAGTITIGPVGVLLVRATTLTQTGVGQINNAGIIVAQSAQFQGGRIVGGVVVVPTSSVSTFDGVELEGVKQLETGATGQIGPGGLTINGKIEVNPGGGNLASSLKFLVDSVLGGSGNVSLNSEDDAVISISPGATATIDSGITIDGRGIISGNAEVKGTIDPGTNDRTPSPGTIELFGNVALDETSFLAVDVMGADAASHDRLSGFAAMTLRGTLVAFVGGEYTPQIGEQLKVIDVGTISGEFDRVAVVGMPTGLGFDAEYTPDKVVLHVVAACVADWNADDIHNTADFVAYLNDFNLAMGGNPTQHDNPDIALPIGTLNTADFVAFLNAFTSGCPS